MARKKRSSSEERRLLAENAALRKELGLSRRPKFEAADGVLENENEALAFQLTTHKRNLSLLDSEEGRAEVLYRLQYLDSIPLPTWAANSKAMIVHWGGAADRTYGYSSNRAMKHNFIDLFVSEPEKAQAIEDLAAIINGREGLEHFNLCKDRDKNGRQIYLVTCCFPVFDPRTSEIVQAEMSVDLSQLSALEEELEELHRKHRAEEDGARQLRLTKKHAVIDATTKELFAELKDFYDRNRLEIERRISINTERVEDERSTTAIKKLHADQRDANRRELREIDLWEAEMKGLIAGADTEAELETVRGTLRTRTRKGA